MSNYKEAAFAGTEWTRCGVVQIINPYQRNPSIQFIEERVIQVGDGRDPTLTPAGSVSVVFDPARQIPLLNPETGVPTGASVTYGEAYAILFSAYIAAALERDTAEAAAAVGGGE